MKYSFGNAQHIGTRASQQDAFGFSNPFEAEFVAHAGLLAVLADGMGGLAHGDLASRAALAAFLAAYRTKSREESVAAALARSLESANAAVCDLAAKHNASGDLGTTLVAAVLRPEGLEWVSVGDSGLFLFHAGKFTALNTSHVYARDLDARVAAGQITQEAAMDDPQRDALTSFLGLPQLTHIDRSVRPLPLDASDSILLASDGLFKTLAFEEMAAHMRGGVQARCDSLVKAVMAKHLDKPGQRHRPRSRPRCTSFPPPCDCPIRRAPARDRSRGRSPARLLATIALAAGGWYFTTCCQMPPLPPMPPPPGVPK